MVNDVTPDKISFHNFTASEDSKFCYAALILFCCDLFESSSFSESVYRTLLHRQNLTSLWEWSGTEIEKMVGSLSPHQESCVLHCHHSRFY